MKTRNVKNFNATGFTLIEVMITVAIIAILAAVALPSYFDYVTRSRFVEAKTSLVDMRTRLEQFFLDNRTYPAAAANCVPATTVPAGAGNINLPANAKFFAVECTAMGPTAYTITAKGIDSMAAFEFTINQANVRQTTKAKTGWATSTTCWISRKNGDC
jgi:type IV pilus assembly protein PilE